MTNPKPYVNYYQESTSISSAEFNNIINRNRFNIVKFELKHIFSYFNKYQQYDYLWNYCYNFI